MNTQVWWFLARASGLVAGALLALSVIWGLLLATRLVERRGLPAWLTDLHRFLGGLTVAAVAVHLAALVADSYLEFSWADLLVPFAAAYHRGPVAWGVVALWLVAAVEVSSLARRRLGRSAWRRIHLLSYPAVLGVGFHAAGTGTDRANPVFVTASLGLVLTMAFLTLYRVLGGGSRPVGRRTTGLATPKS